MKLNEIYLNIFMPEIRVKIIRIEKSFIMVQRIDKGPNFGYQKRFKKGIEQEAFLAYFAPIPPLIFELD
jgi:hypothetical protein